MDLIDIKIENGRFVFDDIGDLVFVRGADRVRQQVEFRLSLWAGEWFLDETFGTPYLLRILGKTAVTVDAAVDALRQQMLDVDGVQSINRLDYTFDAEARKLNVDVDIQSVYGVVTYQSAAQLESASKIVDRTAIDMRATELDPRVIVNSNPVHGIRGAGDYLVMTQEGAYPVEMVNNVQVGRQLPPVALTAFPFVSQTLSRSDYNTLYNDTPGGGLKAALWGAQNSNGTDAAYLIDDMYDGTQLKAGDVLRVDLLIKAYGYSNCGTDVQIFDQANTLFGRISLRPNGTYSVSSGFRNVKVIRYGGGWFRFSFVVNWATAGSQLKLRYIMTNAAGNTIFPSTGNYSSALLISHGVLSLDSGTVPSLRPDGVYTSPAGSISIAKMYGAESVRVLLTDGGHIDLFFGQADHVDLPLNLYDVGDAYIKRIEYRG
jgi:hypothetical protein